MWAAQPPLALGWLGWIAPVPWLALVRRENARWPPAVSRPLVRRLRVLDGRAPLAAFAPPGRVSWLVSLSAYLAIYLPLFVGLSRVAVHQLKIPLWLAAPIVWIGLELARAHVMTGFMMGSLAHTQYRWPIVIQIADLAGEYGVDFVMILVAAAITDFGFRLADRGLKQGSPARLLALLFIAGIALASVLAYGDAQLRPSTNPQSDNPTIRNPPASPSSKATVSPSGRPIPRNSGRS